MRYFIDTEFAERGRKHPIELISVGIVCEDGREYYGVNRDFNPKHANAWVKANVLPHLPPKGERDSQGILRPATAWAWASHHQIRVDLVDFFTRIKGDIPEIWGWCCGYDYVVISQTIGFDCWPDGWHHYFRDVQQIADQHDFLFPDQPKDGEHNALVDARWVKRLYEYAMEVAP